MALEVGQRIGIYKVLTDGCFPAGDFIPGTYRAGCPNPDFLLTGMPKVLANKIDHYHNQFYAMDATCEVKMVATLVVTRVKSQEEMAAFQERYPS